MKFGIDRLLADPALRAPLEGKRIALVAHPASVTEDLTHSLDATIAAGLNVTGAYRMRQRDPSFREQWRLALCDGVARVEALLIEGAAATAEVPRTPDGEIDRIALKHYDPASALAVLKFHGPTARGEATGRGQLVSRDAEALRAMILQRIAEVRALDDGAQDPPMLVDAGASERKGISGGARGDERG